MRYSKDTKEYIQNIEQHLTSKYGAVQDEWKTMITLIADNYELYKKCLKSIEEVGIYDIANARKNPLLSTVKDLQATMIKEIQHLGLSPYAVNKIKTLEEGNDADLLKAILCNE